MAQIDDTACRRADCCFACIIEIVAEIASEQWRRVSC